MAKIMFVHGAGFREPAYTNTCNIISTGLRLIDERHELIPCYWGDDYGAVQPKLSIPTVTSQSVEVHYRETADALWLLLYSDPLVELRILSAEGVRSDASTADESGEKLAGTVRTFEPSPSLLSKFDSLGILNSFKQAREEIPLLAQMNSLLNIKTRDPAPYRQALTRAVIARTLSLAYGRERAEMLSAEDREALVEDILKHFGDRPGGITGLVETICRGIAFGMVTSGAAHNREALTEYASPIAGDILLYQAHGEPIRNFIKQAVLALEGPVVVFAHSLGAIAVLEMLVECADEDLPIPLLVTLGTQVSYLYEIGALTTLNPGDPLPERLPTWINLYDPSDLLSYVCGPVFPGRVRDVEIASHQPIQFAHGAYWTNPATWSVIADALKELAE
ncbi:MAG: hypothetical protein P4L33_06680 [Capsulimonadaceae bacterium]|nr:hypothetical protein [Capsulimonadaceae bacterium]